MTLSIAGHATHNKVLLIINDTPYVDCCGLGVYCNLDDGSNANQGICSTGHHTFDILYSDVMCLIIRFNWSAMAAMLWF